MPPNDRNAADLRNYSRHYRQRLRAEVLLDMASDVTGVPEAFAAMPPGSRAVEVWTARTPNEFLDSFGRPDPNQDPPCERTSDTTVVQALHLMNSNQLAGKVMADGSLSDTLSKSELPPEKIIEELYLACYSRLPTAEEVGIAGKALDVGVANRQAAIEDVLWSLLNSAEFVFNH